jgi:hypothetical protein
MKNETSDNLQQWDNYFPPLNLWNYNLFWRWCEEWKDDTNEDLISNSED